MKNDNISLGRRLIANSKRKKKAIALFVPLLVAVIGLAVILSIQSGRTQEIVPGTATIGQSTEGTVTPVSPGAVTPVSPAPSIEATGPASTGAADNTGSTDPSSSGSITMQFEDGVTSHPMGDMFMLYLSQTGGSDSVTIKLTSGLKLNEVDLAPGMWVKLDDEDAPILLNYTDNGSNSYTITWDPAYEKTAALWLTANTTAKQTISAVSGDATGSFSYTPDFMSIAPTAAGSTYKFTDIFGIGNGTNNRNPAGINGMVCYCVNHDRLAPLWGASMTQQASLPTSVLNSQGSTAAVLALGYPSLTAAQMQAYYGVSSLGNLSSVYSYVSSANRTNYIMARATNEFIWERVYFGAKGVAAPTNAQISSYLLNSGSSSKDGALSSFWYQMEALYQKGKAGIDVLASTLTITSTGATSQIVGANQIYGPFTITATGPGVKVGIPIYLDTANTYVDASNTVISSSTALKSGATFYVRLPANYAGGTLSVGANWTVPARGTLTYYTSPYNYQNMITYKPATQKITASADFSVTSDATGSFKLSGTKVADSGLLTGTRFSFTAVDTLSGRPNQTATGSSDDNGAITFAPFNYTQDDVGVHTVTVTEDTPPSGWSKVTGPITIYLKVVNNYDGTLTVKAYSDAVCAKEITSTLASTLTFHNDQDGAKATILLTKVTVGHPMSSDFQFLFLDYDPATDTGTVRDTGYVTDSYTDYSQPIRWTDGSDVFNRNIVLNYTAPGVYTYYAVECYRDMNAPPGTSLDNVSNWNSGAYNYWTYAPPIKVTVTVTNDAGVFSTNVDYSNPMGVFNTFTNYYDTNGAFTIQGTKVSDSGDELYNVCFYFDVADTFNNETTNYEEGCSEEGAYDEATDTYAQSAPIDFDTIRYTVADVGVHTITVTETYAWRVRGASTAYRNWTFVTNERVFYVKVTDSGDGTLTITPYRDEACTQVIDDLALYLTFHNYYRGQNLLDVYKAVTGHSMVAGQFNFALTDDTGKVLDTGFNTFAAADGDYSPITWKVDPAIWWQTYNRIPGSHDFYVIETGDEVATIDDIIADFTTYKPTHAGGWTYADPVKITIHSDSTVDYSPSDQLVNTFGADTDFTITGTKTADSGSLMNQTFNFTATDTKITLTGEETGSFAPYATVTGTNAVGAWSDSVITFGSIHYTMADVDSGSAQVVHKITVRENTPLPPDWTAVTGDLTFYAKVFDNGEGTLSVRTYSDLKCSDEIDDLITYLTFHNGFLGKSVGASLDANKLANGSAVRLEQFKFAIIDPTTGEVLSLGYSDAADAGVSAPILWDGYNDFTYTDADVSSGATVSYHYTIIELGLAAGNTVSVGDTISPIPTQALPASNGWTYAAPIPATIAVTNNDATMTAKVTYTSSNVTAPQTFTNSYTPTPGALKLIGKKIVEGAPLPDTPFTFAVLDAMDNTISTGANDGSGVITFTPIDYGPDDIGKTFAYTVSEDDFNLDGWEKESASVTIYVKVTDSGGTLKATVYSDEACQNDITTLVTTNNASDPIVFTNAYTGGPILPNAGGTGAWPYLAIGSPALLGAGAWIIIRKLRILQALKKG